jgi:hypothetical protein
LEVRLRRIIAKNQKRTRTAMRSTGPFTQVDYIISTAFSPSSLLSLLKVFSAVFGRISGDGPLESDSFIRITLRSALPHYRAPVVARIYSQWRRENSDNKESIQFHFGFTRHFF